LFSLSRPTVDRPVLPASRKRVAVVDLLLTMRCVSCLLLTPQGGQIKALKTRVKTLEDQLAKVAAGAPGDGSYKSGEAEAEEEVDPKDEM
jgi:hypothetical protein